MNVLRYLIYCTAAFVLLACYRDFDGVTAPDSGDDGTPRIENYTHISGTIRDTLKFSDSPFYVAGDLVVDSATTLTINPGVRLYFAPNTGLLVRGKLDAIGARGYPVLFSALTDTWNGIRIEAGGEQFAFRYCTVEKVNITQENSDGYGALAVFDAEVDIRHSVFRSNTAVYGGGISLRGSSGSVTNNIFRNNSGHAFGGAMMVYQSSVDIHNNTLLKNICINYGGGILLFNSGGSSIQNNIFYRNSDNRGTQAVVDLSEPGLTLQGGFNFIGTDAQPPRFVAEDDLRLAASSPCVDAGNPDEGFNDPDGTRNDQGAFGGPHGNWWADETDPELTPVEPPESEPVDNL